MTRARTGPDYDAEQAILDIQHVPSLIKRGEHELAQRCLESAWELLGELEAYIHTENSEEGAACPSCGSPMRHSDLPNVEYRCPDCRAGVPYQEED